MNIDIFQSARRDDISRFSEILTAGDIGKVTQGNRNLLHIAIAYRRPDIAEELIRRGVNVNHCDANGESPLHYAAIHKQSHVAQLIIHNGGDVTRLDKHGNSPLWTAVFNARGNYEIVSLFLEKGALPTQKNAHGRSPLDFAQQIGDQKLVGLLVQFL